MRSILTMLCIVGSSQVFAGIGRDSVGVENENGKQVILHKVEAKDNFYSIGRLYNVTPKRIMSHNSQKVLHVGDILKVPTERVFVARVAEAPRPSQHLPANTEGLIDYKVGPKETLFAISRRFNITVDELKRLNNLSSNSLSVGQIIKVRQSSGLTNPVASAIGEQVSQAGQNQAVRPLKDFLKKDSTDTAAIDKTKINTNRYGVTEKAEKGVAVWIADSNLDSNKMLALHRSAPVGTVIRVTNPMTGKSTFAKVVGKFTENDTTHDVIIVLTKATADLLGALDKRFQVTLEYGVPNNE